MGYIALGQSIAGIGVESLVVFGRIGVGRKTVVVVGKEEVGGILAAVIARDGIALLLGEWAEG